MHQTDYQNLLAAFNGNKATPVQIPLQGSLELLAMGDLGLIAWRHAKQVFADQQKSLNKPPFTNKDKENEQ